MSEPPVATNDPLEDNLVAYLDGELDAQSSAEIEQRLSADPAFRERLLELQRSWDMLDLLPEGDVSQDFTRTTVEMAAVSAEGEAVAAAHQARTTRRRLLWGAAAAGMAAMIVGYWWMAARLRAPNEQLINDLPVIQNIDNYRHIDNFEFLLQLEESGLFSEKTLAESENVGPSDALSHFD